MRSVSEFKPHSLVALSPHLVGDVCPRRVGEERASGQRERLIEVHTGMLCSGCGRMLALMGLLVGLCWRMIQRWARGCMEGEWC